MEPGDGDGNLKRQRTPLSDSEDNLPSTPERNVAQKRRRLERADQENRSPQPSTSGRSAELQMKPDTPALPSIRSRVRQFTQRREGGAPLAQRCLSDPGADSPSAIIQDKAFKEHLLSEGEFDQRVARFKVPLLLPSPAPTPGPASNTPRTLSDLVSGIQGKLKDSETPSSKKASRIRQEREQELRLLLKRSNSDPSLAEQEDGSFIEASTSGAEKLQKNVTETDLSSHDEGNTAEMIDQMFGEVLEYAGMMEEEKRQHDEEAMDRDSGVGTYSGDKDKMDTDSEEKSEEEEAKEEEGCDFPPIGPLSPLSMSVEAAVTPLQLAVSQQSNPSSLLLSPEETTTPPAESDSLPLYSIDAYRTQRQNKRPPIQSVTPRIQRGAQDKLRPQPSINIKDKIMALNEEAGKLQTVITQSLQALSCCTDEEHGRGSLEEAEAEKLLLVSSEKRSALLTEVARLREERTSETEAAGRDDDYISQRPCRGTVSISKVQLPLKLEFVCSSRNWTGRPSHYFFVLIRYGPCNFVATPLATAADALNGDTISFPTSITLKDIRSNFEIDVEVYSLSHTSGSSCSADRATTKSRVTPRKLLNTIKRSNNTMTSATLPTLNSRRASNFCLVGSHKISLASLGQNKFPLDKMKLEGKVRRLLGDEFQEKVPFLSPLEGNIYLHLDSKSHSSVQHQGFLTMFELMSGFGVWHRRFFVLEGYRMYYWNHPNDRESKAAEGSVFLSDCPRQIIKPVKRDSCARPFTFELVRNVQTEQQGNSEDASAKCWFSADTKQDRLDWMERLNQVLLDFHTWSRTLPAHTDTRQSDASCSGDMRESVL